MDKYLLIILMFMFAGIVISMTRQPMDFILFYASIGGAIVVVIYSSIKSRREQKELRRQRRKSKK